MKLWYSRPAEKWQQGLPIGNGRLGAVIYGGIGSEIWSLTESTYWSGQPEGTGSRSAGKTDLERLRKLFFEGDYVRGEALAAEVLQPEKGNFGTHLPMCDLQLDFGGHDGDEFVRELSLEQAVVSVSYRSEGHVFTRETFATHADGIMAARIGCDEPGSISFVLSLAGRTERFSALYQEPGICTFRGRATETVHSDGQCGVSGSGMVKVLTRGGTVRAEAGGIVVQNADEAWIYFAANTDYGTAGEAWATECERQIERAVLKGYVRLKEDHVADYRRLYARVAIELGPEPSGVPTDERIRRLRNGRQDDPQLFALFYQYGRYLMIAGSRADSPLPLNLQGIWNDGEANRMAWSCDYHLDINTEMNYYPAETGNLAECHLPLIRYVEQLSVAGKSAAKDFYGCDGWVAHVFSNAWGFASPGWHYSWGLNVTGGLWIAGQLCEHYEFNLDRRFLAKTAYPVLKEAAVFFLDYMTVHPKYGWLVTGPSNSPENSFYPDGGQPRAHQLSMGPTMDQVLVRDLFEFCKEAAGRLQTDAELQRRLEEAIALLPPLKVGKSGRLQEWLEDYAEAQPEHRHLSHLVALYPGSQVTPVGTPEWSEAARSTLINRMGGEGLEDVEFTLALFAAGLARLKDGDGACRQLAYLVGQLCFDNLLTYSKPGIAGAETNIFVVDGNFGGTAAIAEMLLQSHAGAFELLPAVPGNWHTGKVTGLRAKGNAEVDLTWGNGQLVEAVVRAFSPGQTLLRYREREISLQLVPGAVYRVNNELRVHERDD